MKLGFFIMPVHPPGRNYAETLREDREAFILADKLGYSEGYCGEHLTDLAENIPSSLMFCASLAGFTKNIKLGTAVSNLPFCHPLLVATQAALVDNLLEGRLLFGIGAGVLRTDMEALELLDADRGAMFAEAIDHIHSAVDRATRPTISRANTGTSRPQRRNGRRSDSAKSSSRSRSRIRRSSAPRPSRNPRD